MKEYVSRFLKTVSFVYLGFPLVFLIYMGTIFGVEPSGYVGIVLSPIFYLVSFFAILTGFGLWEVKRWSWSMLVVTNLLILYFSADAISRFGQSDQRALGFFVTLALLALAMWRIETELRVPYFLPRIRWWESYSSYRYLVPVKIFQENGTAIDGKILDLSHAGCFIKINQEFNEHEKLRVHFMILDYAIECVGIVVWRTRSTVTHPKGIGLKFERLPKKQSRKLKVASQRLSRALHSA